MRRRSWIVSDRLVGTRESPEAVLRRILANRGLNDAGSQDDFLNPKLKNLRDPFRLPDMDKAVGRVDEAILQGEQILIYSDYDVDGMSSSALLYRFLSHLGAKVRVFIPERQGEGYGLSIKGLERALADRDTDLLIALDCGTTSHEQVAQLNKSGIDVVILDHHELTATLPDAVAFVNPQRGEHDQLLATVGLVFKFCHAFLKMRGSPGLFDLRSHMDFVALGTVADMVPLLDDNRIFVRYGLEQMARTEHVGLRALMDVSGLRKDPTPGTIGFVLGPRLNASGRLSEAAVGWELLTTRDPGNARRIAMDLDQLNRERQRLEQEAHAQAEAMFAAQDEQENSHCIVVASETWHQGVVGIVASRLQKAHYRPAVVISIGAGGHGKGSARSIEGCSMMDALRANAPFLTAFGGHAMASGLEIQAGQIDGFRKALNHWFRTQATGTSYEERLHVDLELSPGCLTAGLADSLGELEPFGQKNSAPVIVVRNVSMGRSRVMAEKHLRFQASSERTHFPVIGFGFAKGEQPVGNFDLAGHWGMDDFSGRPLFQMVDWQWA